MTPRPAAASPAPHSATAGRALAALFLATFVVGSAELVVVGVLSILAGDLAVSEGAAGLTVTAYALGIAVGGPVLTAATIRLPRRSMLRVAFLLYVVGNLAAALSASFVMLVAMRLVTGALHGVFVGVALGVAVAIVPAERMGRAIGLVLGGIAVSTAFGVPLGTLIAQQAGWRAAFVAIVVLGAVAFVAMVQTVPSTTTKGATGLRGQLRDVLTVPVVTVLMCAFLLMGGQFAALTFLTPFLEDVTGLGPSQVALFLLVYGLASAAGTLLGGRAADLNANLTLLSGTALVVVSLGLLRVAGESPVVAAGALVVWGVAGWAVVPALQYRTVSLADGGRDLAATLPVSATTGGIALGSVLGGWGLTRFGSEAPPTVAALACLAVLPLVWVTTRFGAREGDRRVSPGAEDVGGAAEEGQGAAAGPLREREQERA